MGNLRLPDKKSDIYNIDPISKKGENCEHILKYHCSRALSPCENFFSAAHETNLYFGFMITGIFKPISQYAILDEDVLFPAMDILIRQNPALSTILVDRQNNNPRIAICDTIDLNNHVVFIDGETSESQRLLQYEKLVSNKVNDSESIPPWKLIISKLKPEFPGDSRFEIGSFMHHAVFDGVSGNIVLMSLVTLLNTIAKSNTSKFDIKLVQDKPIYGTPQDTRFICLASKKSPILQLQPDLIPLPVSAEDAMGVKEEKIPNSVTENTINIDEPTYWTGIPNPKEPIKVDTKIARERLSSATMKKLLKRCREEKTTVSCTLAAIVSAAVHRSIPKESYPTEFGDCGGINKEGRPYKDLHVMMAQDLRPSTCPLSNVKKDTMGLFVTTDQFTVSRNDLVTPENIWNQSRQFKKSMKADISQHRTSLDFFPHVYPYFDFFNSLRDCPRATSCIVSTLLMPPVKINPDDNWEMIEMGTLQSGRIDGPVSLTTISFKGGELVVTFTWTRTAVPDELIHAIILEFSKIATDIANSESNESHL